VAIKFRTYKVTIIETQSEEIIWHDQLSKIDNLRLKIPADDIFYSNDI